MLSVVVSIIFMNAVNSADHKLPNSVNKDENHIAFLIESFASKHTTFLNATIIRKIMDIYRSHCFKLDPSQLIESANTLNKQLNHHNNNSQITMFEIFDSIIADNVHNFKRMVNDYLYNFKFDSMAHHTMTTLKTSYHMIVLFEETLLCLGRKSPLLLSTTTRQSIDYQYNFIINYHRNLYQDSWELYCTPSFSANIADIKYCLGRQAVRRQSVRNKRAMLPEEVFVTVKLRTRYIIHFLRAIPVGIIGSKVLISCDEDVAVEILQIIRQLKKFEIYHLLDLLRDELLKQIPVANQSSCVQELVSESIHLQDILSLH